MKTHFILITALFSFSSLAIAKDDVCKAGEVDVWAKATFATNGDTLIVQGQDVRLIGINAPEIEKKHKFFQKGQPLAKISQTFLNKLITNNGLEVGLVYEKKKNDTLGRNLAHVYFRDGSNAQQRILEAGMAIVEPATPNTKIIPCLLKAEKKARDNKTALWGLPEKYPQFNYPLAKSNKLTREDIGFRIIKGKVVYVSKSSTNYIINLDTTGIRVKKDNWKHFDYSKIKALKGKEIEVRGFGVQYRGAMYVTIDSPYAIDLLAKQQK